MSTLIEPPRTATSSPEGNSPFDRYIEEQLDRTRRDVQLVDFFRSLMVLAAWFLGALLVVAIVDHWVLALPVWLRWLLFCGLVGGAAWHVVTAILPLLVKPLNPVYLARTIEQSQPSLKNSLINFLLFRADRAGLRSSVYETLKQRAASDLSHVPIDTAVDRKPLIHVGYVLIAVLVAFAAYVVASPKSPFRSVYRVVAPWSDTPRPSRVRIEDVAPGDQRVFHGDRISVSAKCYDVYEREPVQLFYSSLDGRFSRQTIVMQAGEDQLVYRAQLPPEDDGIQQDIVYWIEAGDAVTAAYRLTVVPAPTILVQRVEYDFPAYTGQAKKVVERQPDLEGLEGTRVTLHAQANQPIRWASVVFDTPSEANPAGPAPAGGVTGATAPPVKLPMQVDGNRALASFVLELDPQRDQAWHSSYQLQFETTEGQQNSRIPIHGIVVTRDLAPEIEILTPAQDRIELPVDRTQKIELRAIDPDFGLRRLTLRAAAGGKEILAQQLLDQPAGQAGQVVGSYEFRPAAHALRPGETLLYWGTAEDTRCQPATGEPEPNVAKTRAYQITILPPENVGTPEPAGPQDEPTPDQPGVSQESPPPGPTDPPSAAQGNQQPQPGQQSGDSGQENPSNNPSPESPDSAEPQGGASSDSAGSTGQAGDSRGQDASSPAGGSQGTGQSGSSGEQSGSGQSAGSGDQGQGSSGDSNAGGSGQSTSSGGDRQGSSTGSSGDSPSAGEPGAAPSAGAPGAAPPADGASASPSAGQAGADSAGQPGKNAEPLHDGEVFERTLQYLQSQKPSGQDASGSSSSGQDGTGSTPSGGTQSPPPGTGQQGTSSPASDAGQAGSEGRSGADQPSDAPGQAGAGSSQGDSGQQDQGQAPNAQSQPGGSAQPQESSPQPGGTGQQPSGGADSTASPTPSPPAGGQDSPQTPSPATPKPDSLPSSAAGQSGSPPSGSEPKPADQPRGSGEGQPQQSGAGQQQNQGGGSQPNESQGGSAGGQKQEPNSGQSSAPSGGGQPKPGQEPQAPSVSKKASSGGGDSQGDRSGGGKQGGGQGGNQPGQGSPGSQTPADAGQGASEQSGSGPAANRPGDRPGAQSDDGTSGTQKGYGSTTQPTPGGSGPGGEADSTSPSTPDSNPPAGGSPSNPDVHRRGQGVPMGGGQPSAAELHGADAPGEVPPGDQPNLEYSRKATDLVLDYLKDQQQNPDPGLLDRLGWTRDELQQFLTRWESLRRSARQDPAAGRELDEALRSLGLRAARPQPRSAAGPDDAVRGLRDAGSQSAPPASYLDQFRAYKKGTARTEGN